MKFEKLIESSHSDAECFLNQIEPGVAFSSNQIPSGRRGVNEGEEGKDEQFAYMLRKKTKWNHVNEIKNFVFPSTPFQPHPSGCIFAFVCDRKKCDFLVFTLPFFFVFLSCGERMFEKIEKCNEANVIPLYSIVCTCLPFSLIRCRSPYIVQRLTRMFGWFHEVHLAHQFHSSLNKLAGCAFNCFQPMAVERHEISIHSRSLPKQFSASHAPFFTWRNSGAHLSEWFIDVYKHCILILNRGDEGEKREWKRKYFHVNLYVFVVPFEISSKGENNTKTDFSMLIEDCSAKATCINLPSVSVSFHGERPHNSMSWEWVSEWK